MNESACYFLFSVHLMTPIASAFQMELCCLEKSSQLKVSPTGSLINGRRERETVG